MGLTRQQFVMVAVLLSGTLLAVLNQTLLSPALPAIMASLQVDATTIQWLTSGYSLVEAVIIPLSAFLIGRFTTRQLFITGFAIFTAGSLLAALAPAFPFLLAGRVLQAACTGMVMPMVFTVILLVFPREKRGSAMGVIGLIIGFAPAIGPSVSGLLVDSVGWRALFVIVTALSALVLAASALVLKNYGDFERTTFDKLSVMLSSVGLVCLLYGLSTFASSSNMAVTGGLIAAGIVLMALYIRRQLRLEVPMLKVSILKARPYATAVCTIVIIQAALMGTGVITPLYIQGVLGQSATMSGVAMLPGAVIGAFLGLVAGRLFDRYGVRRVVIPGGIVMLAGAAGLVLLGMNTSIVMVTTVYTVLTMGLQFIMTPLNTWGLNSLDNSVIQHTQGLSNTLNQIAASFGTAMLVSVSALGSSFAASAGAAGIEQSFAGTHLAFCTTSALLVVALVVIVALVRDKAPARAARAEDAKAKAGEGVEANAAAGSGATASATAADSDDVRVRDAMNLHPVYVSANATMRDVVLLMAETDTSGVPVVDEDYVVVGFVTDGDVAQYLGKNDMAMFDASLNLYHAVDDGRIQERLSNLLDLNVMKIATRRVLSTTPDARIDEACHILATKRIKKMPVVNAEGKLVGALSRRNIIHAIAAGEQAKQR
ncbi:MULTISPECIES: MDR family MFS transporter [unclassified Adlercreutzia]|uniref:MDR family MFS transporter n=1 Tax=unclassified Adlercreutzia TaxID=2636013 RepID=UPI0013EA0EB2|nr:MULTISPECIES: MDR family MFS transporter [unclassified Adlercreutzia]